MMKQSTPVKLTISQYAAQLHLLPNTQTRAKEVIAQAETAGLTAGKNPEAIIAAALYIAGILEDDPHTLAEVAKVTGVALNTVQKHKTRIVLELGIRKGR
jgi:transcription initiation factor TFIIB